MEIPIQLKPDTALPESITSKKWKKGEMISTVTMGDGVGYAVILTEHHEFDIAPFYAIAHIDFFKPKRELREGRWYENGKPVINPPCGW